MIWREDGEIGWSDNLDAAAVRLRIEFLQLTRFDNRSECDLAVLIAVYYRSTAAWPHTAGCGAAAHFLSGYNGNEHCMTFSANTQTK